MRELSGISPGCFGVIGIKSESFYSLDAGFVGFQYQGSMVWQKSFFLFDQDQASGLLPFYPPNFSTVSNTTGPEALSARGGNGYCSMPDTTHDHACRLDVCSIPKPSNSWDFKPSNDMFMRGTSCELPVCLSGFL